MNKGIYIIIGLIFLGCNEENNLDISTQLINKSIEDNSIELDIRIKNISGEKVAIQNPILGFNMHFELITAMDTLFYPIHVNPALDASNYIVLEKNQIIDDKLIVNRFGIPIEGANEFRLKDEDVYEYIIYYYTGSASIGVFDEKEFLEFYGFDPELIINEKYTLRGKVD